MLLSLSYLPTAERLSVVVMKAKNIELKSEEAITKNQTTVPSKLRKYSILRGNTCKLALSIAKCI